MHLTPLIIYFGTALYVASVQISLSNLFLFKIIIFNYSYILGINLFFLEKCRLDWPVRALSFSYDGKMLASGSEDLYVDIADVTTGEKVRFHFRYLLFKSVIIFAVLLLFFFL